MEDIKKVILPEVQRRELLSQTITELLRESIIKGDIPPGTKLNKEPELAKELNISRSTLRAALDRLTLEGLLVRKRGRGTFVPDQPLIMNNLNSNGGVTALIESTGAKAGTSEIVVERKLPGKRVGKLLDIDSDEYVFVVTRTRTANDWPFVYSCEGFSEKLFESKGISITPEEFKSRLIEKESLYTTFETLLGIIVHHGIAKLNSVIANNSISNALRIPHDAAVTHLEQVDYDEEDNIIMFSDEYYPGDLTFSVYRSA